MTMDWFWLVLAVGVFAAVAVVPISLAFDAVSSWRDYRRSRVAQRLRDVREGT
jgi:hypothetical protein